MFWLLFLGSLNVTLDLPNLGFEQDLRGWRVGGHPGFRPDVMDRGDAAEGTKYLRTGWRARNAAGSSAQTSITTSIDAAAYRGYRVRFSAMTRVPDFAAGASSLIARTDPTSASRVATSGDVGANEHWLKHSIDFLVPNDAHTLTIGFRTRGTAGELDADAAQLQILD